MIQDVPLKKRDQDIELLCCILLDLSQFLHASVVALFDLQLAFREGIKNCAGVLLHRSNHYQSAIDSCHLLLEPSNVFLEPSIRPCRLFQQKLDSFLDVHYFASVV